MPRVTFLLAKITDNMLTPMLTNPRARILFAVNVDVDDDYTTVADLSDDADSDVC